MSRILKGDETIGVSAGMVVHEAAQNFLPKNQMENIRFIPLVGGLGQEHTALQANVVCEIFARKSGGAVLELHAPITVDSAEAKRYSWHNPLSKTCLIKAKKQISH